MGIDKKKPISMAEVVNLVGDSEKSVAIKSFIKNFEIVSIERATKIKEVLESLDFIRLKDYHIVKIIDFMPGDATELNKIVSDASFEQEEINKILDVVKNN
jgi:DNA-directed RNA polymerase subunit F